MAVADFVAVLSLLVSFMGMLFWKDGSKSTKWLKIATAIALFWGFCDTLSYLELGPQPDLFLHVVNCVAYTFGNALLACFMFYCWMFFRERTRVSPWMFGLPIAIAVFGFALSLYSYVACEIVVIENGIAKDVGTLPPLCSYLQSLVIIYIPCIALVLRKKIGTRAFILFGSYGLVTFAVIPQLFFSKYDFSAVAAMLTLSLFINLLQRSTAEKMLQRMNRDLLDSKKSMENFYRLIDTLNNEYHTIWLVDRDSLTMRMVRSTGKTTISAAVNMVSEFQTYEKTYLRYIENFVMPEDQDRVRKEISPEIICKHIDQSKELYTVNYLRKTPDGTMGYHQMAFADASLKSGKRQFVLAFRDVDKLIKAEQIVKQDLERAKKAADAANEAKTTFLFSMSHDIRTPLNAITGLTDLIGKHIDDKKRVLEYLEKIQSANSILLSLVNNVLEVAQIESGKITLDEHPYRTGEVTAAVVSVFSDSMKKKGIHFNHSVEVNTKFVFMDLPKIKEIFLNLVSNAYKYTPAGGNVSVDIKEYPSDKEGYAKFEAKISDTGIGMSKEFLPHLFE